MSEVITENGGAAIWTKLDVTIESDWQAALSVTQERWEPVDVLVASADVSFVKPVTKMSLGEWRRIMEVNLDGVFLGTKHAVRRMREGSGGSIIIISSASGTRQVRVRAPAVPAKPRCACLPRALRWNAARMAMRFA